ncbi:MAG: hypothetical protein ABL886_08670, partial [Rhodoglobus sp.]
MSIRAALLIALTGSLVFGPAALAHSLAISDALNEWVPSDATWSQTESLDTDGTRGDCSEGRVTRWSNDVGETAGMVWARCPSAAAAAALLRTPWSGNGLFPAV